MDIRQFALIVPLGFSCAFGIGRLLWWIEGKPRLDRPRWWPTGRSGRGTAKTM